MKLARTYSFSDTRVEEAPEPTLEPGDLLLHVEACGLCGSDASPWYVERKSPTVLGHEPAGYVAKSRSPSFKEGERVFVHHHVPCGLCHHCKRGAETSCDLGSSSVRCFQVIESSQSGFVGPKTRLSLFPFGHVVVLYF